MKLIGYLLCIIGIVAIALRDNRVKAILGFPLPAFLSSQILIYLGAIAIFIGLFYVLRGGRRTNHHGGEVPIYHGNRVVGYRRA